MEKRKRRKEKRGREEEAYVVRQRKNREAV